jgi:hypothetical protein
VKDYSHP